MLIYAWDLTSWREIARFASEPSPNLSGLLGRVLVDSTRTLLQHQLGREYVKRTTAIPGIRGRIRFGSSLRFIGNKESKLVCEFNALDIDTPRNRIIRSTLHQLANDKRVENYSEGLAPQLIHDIRELNRDMDGVTLTNISNAQFAILQLGRNDRHYVLPLKICALIHQLRMPEESAGTNPLAKLLRDEDCFAGLFERFVRNFYSHHIGDKYEVKSEGLKWPGSTSSQYMPMMRTDISIIGRRPPHERLIIDTKYYRDALTSNRGGPLKFKTENLYQIYAYLRTQEGEGENYRNARGMLLYPTVDYELKDWQQDVLGTRHYPIHLYSKIRLSRCCSFLHLVKPTVVSDPSQGPINGLCGLTS